MKESDKDRLLQRYIAGELDDKETGRVRDLIREDPVTAERLYGYALQEAELEKVFGMREVHAPSEVRRLSVVSVRFAIPMAAAALVLVAAGYFLWLSGSGRESGVAAIPAQAPERDRVVVASVKGSAVIRDVRTGRRDLRMGDPARAGETVLTAGGGEVALVCADHSSVVVKGNSEVELRAVEVGWHFHLKQGEIETTVMKQPAGASFVVTTPHARCTVVGTRLTVVVSGEGTNGVTVLKVFEGTVRMEGVDGPAKTAEVNAGESLAMGPGAVADTIRTAARARAGRKESDEVVIREFQWPVRDTNLTSGVVSVPKVGRPVYDGVSLWIAGVEHADPPKTRFHRFDPLTGQHMGYVASPSHRLDAIYMFGNMGDELWIGLWHASNWIVEAVNKRTGESAERWRGALPEPNEPTAPGFRRTWMTTGDAKVWWGMVREIPHSPLSRSGYRTRNVARIVAMDSSFHVEKIWEIPEQDLGTSPGISATWWQGSLWMVVQDPSGRGDLNRIARWNPRTGRIEALYRYPFGEEQTDGTMNPRKIGGYPDRLAGIAADGAGNFWVVCVPSDWIRLVSLEKLAAWNERMGYAKEDREWLEARRQEPEKRP